MLACSWWVGWSVPSRAKYRSAVNWASMRAGRLAGDYDHGVVPHAGIRSPGGRASPPKEALMVGSQYEPITVSRRIGAPASVIFPILADPGRHRELDGSGMVRGVVSGTTISAVGDVFVMSMYFDELGDYQMINHVVEYQSDRRIG
jgi:hypothetical protein